MRMQHLSNQTWVLFRWAAWFTPKNEWWYVGYCCFCDRFRILGSLCRGGCLGNRRTREQAEAAEKIPRILLEEVQNDELVGYMGWCRLCSQELRLESRLLYVTSASCREFDQTLILQETLHGFFYLIHWQSNFHEEVKSIIQHFTIFSIYHPWITDSYSCSSSWNIHLFKHTLRKSRSMI